MATKKKSKKDSGSLMGMILFRYMPYWPLFLILFIVCCTTAWFYLKYVSVPKYRTTASILVNDHNKGSDVTTAATEGPVSEKKIVENELEVIASRTLIKQIVDSLALYAPIYEEDFARKLSAYASSPIIVWAQDAEELESQPKVYFTYNKNTEKVSIGANTFSLDKWENTPFGTLKFTKNLRKTREAEHPLFFSLVKPKKAIDGISNNLKAGVSNKLSSVIELTYEDEVAKRGKDVINELIEAYTMSAVREKAILARKTIDFLNERIVVVGKELDSIEAKEKNYKSSNGIVDLNEQGKNILANMGENDNRLTQINNKLTVLDQVQSYVNSKGNNAGIVPSTLEINDPTLTGLLNKLYQAEISYDNLKKSRAENDPIMIAARGEIDKIRPSISENIGSLRRNLEASKSNLSSTNTNYSQVLQTIPEKDRGLVEINRQKTIKADVYKNLLNKREETALQFESVLPDNRIVDSAESSIFPVSPKKPFIFLVAIVLALIAGIGFVSAKEFMTNKITFRSEIEDYTSVPVIAEISHVAKRTLFKKNAKKLAKATLAEQFRQLRMALRLYRKQATKRRLMVTSSIGGEGKSFVSSNLAKSLASSGKKVVLIDFDMRNPKTSGVFNMMDKAGIKEYLDGEKEIEDIIQKTEYENLFLIPAGAQAINPTELLLDSRLATLLTYLENSFDYVLCDTAPIQPVTDAYIISEFCDTTLFVIRHRYTPKAMIQLLDENNKIKALKNLNIVFNDIKSRGFLMVRGVGYGYAYGYGYEYGYADRKYMSSRGKED